MSSSIHFLNGEFVKEEKLLISPRDLGFSRGFAVFETFRTYDHKPFALSHYLDRLFNSARIINLVIPWDKEQITEWVLATLAKNEYETEKTIKIYISGGVSYSVLPEDKPTIIIIVDPLKKYPPELYEKGSSVITIKFTRPVAMAKSTNYVESIKYIQEAHKKGAIEPVYYDDQQVFEGSNSCIFALIDGKLLTPKTKILKSITREVLVKILSLEIPIEEQNFTKESLLQAKEVFLASSVRGIVPIIKVDDAIIGSGQVGVITKEVMRQFSEYTKV